MKNKKAWIRIAEAAIAIMLLASVILVIIGQQAEKQDIGEAMYNLQHKILDEASKNDTIRDAILSENTGMVKAFIKERISIGLNFTIQICNLNDACTIELPGKELYVDDVLISSTLQEYALEPKKLRFFVWIE
jgi:hypothetical protein